MTDTPDLRILLLGSPAIFSNDQPLQIQRRLLRWLLFYLACQKEMVGRADLILTFWPDAAEEDARRHLREMLSKLRAQLPDPDLIITEQDRVGLNPMRIFSDVQEFQSLFAQTARACAQTPASTPLTQAVHQKVVQAVRLWRSERFLAGASLPESENLNDWVLSMSQQLENQRARLLERLVDHDFASGDIEGAIHWLQTALTGDETNESLHYRLLNLLYRHNRYSEALNYCTYLQELFRREGFSELPPSLLSLSRQIREEAAHPAANSGPSWPSLADIQVPFVGRQNLLRDLQFATRRGSPVILFGEGGSGKSRLVRELFFSFKPAPRLLLAPGRRMETHLPFQPVIDMLRRDVHAEEWQQMDMAWLTPLTLLLPELAIMRPGLQPLLVPAEQERSLVFEALRQLFLFLGRKQRLLLFLEDAQWSDEETLSALAYLVERGLTEENGALILTARPEELSPHLLNFLNRPRSGSPVQRFSLPPLDSEEIGLLARYVLDDAASPSLVARLERDSGGNPLFLLETLRLVLDYSLAPQTAAPGERLPLASTVYAVIRERLQQLTPYQFQVLNIAAVIGSEFSTDILEKTSMLTPEQVAEALEALAQGNLIQAVLQDRPSSGYAFVHEKVREVVLLDLSPARKRLFHLRIARALDQEDHGQSAALEAALASHYEEAGELNAASQHWLQTSQFAWRIYDKETALSTLERAETILLRLGSQATDISIYQLYRQWGRLATYLSDPEMMDQVFQRMLEHGQHRQNPLLIGSAYNGFAQAAELRLQPPQGLAFLDKATPFLDQTGRIFERIEALNHRGLFLILTGAFHEAQSIFQKALEIGARASDTQAVEARSQTEYMQSIILALTGWPVLALEMAERSMRDAEEAFYPFGRARAISMQAINKTYLGQHQEALQLSTEGLALAQKIHSAFLAGDLHGAAARTCLETGDLDGCWEHIRQAQALAANYPYSFLKEGMDCLRGDLYALLGDHESAEAAYRAGSAGNYANFQALDCRIHLAAAVAARGETARAHEIIDEAIVYALQSGMMIFHITGQLTKAGILIGEGRVEEARPLLDFVAAEARQRCLPGVEIRAALAAAAADLRDGNGLTADHSIQQAIDGAKSLGSLPLEMMGYTTWLAAAGSAAPRLEYQRLQQALLDHTRTPELRALLTKTFESVDKNHANQ